MQRKYSRFDLKQANYLKAHEISVASGTCHDIRIIRRQQGNSKECQSQVRAGGLRCEAKSIIFAAPQIDCGLDQQHAQRVVHPARCKALQILLLTYISFRRKETHAQHNSFCNSRCLNGLTASVNTEMTIAIAIIDTVCTSQSLHPKYTIGTKCVKNNAISNSRIGGEYPADA